MKKVMIKYNITIVRKYEKVYNTGMLKKGNKHQPEPIQSKRRYDSFGLCNKNMLKNKERNTRYNGKGL